MLHPDARNLPGNTGVSVWDTQYVPPRDAFSIYREAISQIFMPWTPAAKPDTEFQARIEALTIGQGAIGRLQLSPLVAQRTKRDIANSAIDCFNANFVVSGELKLEQRGQTNFLKSGDLAVYDGSLPITLSTGDGGGYEVLAVLIPKEKFSTIKNAEEHFQKFVLSREQLMRPLSSCLTFLANNMLESSKEELSAIFDACLSLLPVAAACFKAPETDDVVGLQSNYLLREILDFINRNIADPNLTPQLAADYVGISIRYVHKLFAASGTTFGSYVLAKRLYHVRTDLLLPTSRRQPISLVAQRWGFNDASTFFRSFKKRFACAPSRFRAIH
jgi:AraC family transcriptional regulator, positive regulator of tynA and feaB